MTPPSRWATVRNQLVQRQRLVLGTASVIAFLTTWQIAADQGWVNVLFTSSPLAIVQAGQDIWSNGQLALNFKASAELFVLGFLLSVAIAIPLGIAMGWYRWFDAIVDPFVSILYATPRIALIPLVLVWAGIGFESRLIVVVLAAVFPLLINTIAGVRATDPQLLRVSRSYLGSDLAIFRTLVIPSAIPYIISGLRHAINQALIGVVVAEFFGGNIGLGAMITSAGLELRTDIAFVGVLIIAGSALLLTALLRIIESRLTAWRE
ncbi:ABC transporter permease [Micromonospora craniellae]|uniref:ABC transporter permease n=1 Tax=Micromonospora craniellae TaxID=2294034 RepID=UPI0011C1901C|nr:ABC transporter permease [Micromonospora craniellae]QOC93400.1 ABC transporter permease [Micromonospora craniellae]